MRKITEIFKRLLTLLFHPLLIAMGATVVVILIVHSFWDFSKYQIELADSGITQGSVLYDDLDNNGYSDHVMVVNNPIGTIGLSCHLYPQNYVEQWNFRGEVMFLTNENLITGDYDRDGKKEIYCFSVSGDSIFINYVTDLNQGKGKQRFITKVSLKDGKCDPFILPLEMDDLDQDGYDEVVFGISTGFSIYPRNVFSYSPVNETVRMSPKSAAGLTIIAQEDITGDGKSEFLLYNYAPGNLHETGYIYHDSSTWLMVLNRKLEFLFPPIEFEGNLTSLTPFVLHPPGSRPVYSAFHTTPSKGGSKPMFCTYDTLGNCISKKSFDKFPINTSYNLIKSFNRKHDHVIANSKNELLVLNSSLDIVSSVKFKGNIQGHKTMDIDLDGEEEIILSTPNIRKIQVFRSNLKNQATIDIALPDANVTHYSLKKVKGMDPLLSIQSGMDSYLLSYGINPMFYWRWAIYASIYLIILLFTLFVRNVQRIQLQRKYAAEKKITELQLTIVRNQLDPHFVFNAINSIINSVRKQKQEEATDHLQHFAQMYRSLVLSSDKISRTLAEEIAFTENYLKMEQFRFKEKFQYAITIDPAIDQQIEIPKMIIQSYAENAVKHGLISKTGTDGFLEIKAFQHDAKLEITIKDNGQGRKEAISAGSGSTGKGLEMMNNLYDLYYKITNRKITAEIVDLYDEEGKASGTAIKVTIPIR